jgi:hypothetical protein
VSPIREHMEKLRALSATLDASEHKRQKVLDFMQKAPMICFVKDAETGRYQFISAKGAEAVGLPENQIIGKTDWEIYPENIAKMLLAHDIKVLKEREEFIAIESRTYADKTALYLVSRFLIENGATLIGGFAFEIPDTFRLEPVNGAAI